MKKNLKRCPKLLDHITTQKIQHRYNLMGERIATLLPDGNEINYHYGPSGGFTELRYNGQTISQIERNSLGQEQGRHHGVLSTSSEYDPQGRLIKQQIQHREGRQTIIQRDYRYNASGNLASLKESTAFGNSDINYLYDTLDRLKRIEGSHPEFFNFDPAGNLISIADTRRAPKGQSKGNRLFMQGDAKFEYDARGNLIEERRGSAGKLKKSFHYDLNNQLINVDIGHQNVCYKYDPLGRRISKTDGFGTTSFQWSGNQLISETRHNIKKTYLFEPGSHRPLAQVQDGNIYHYHLDHLGTPRELTDETGNIVWKARYKTYGALALKEVDEVENNLRFQGQYYDAETGLHYNRFRYYSPNTGQFINQDPIGLLGGVNNYQYVDNPINWIDPLGLAAKQCGEGCVGVAKYAVDDFSEVAGKISQKQMRHLSGRNEYQRGGYLNSLDDAQNVLDAYRSSSTTILGKSQHGFPIVKYEGVTGTNVNVGAGISNQPTNVFMIKGTKSPSIVPMNPNWAP